MENRSVETKESHRRLSTEAVGDEQVIKRSNRNSRKKLSSLLSLCRSVVVANLERYPPETFGICDEEEWIAIVKLRHNSTRPKEGQGGLDGTGRLVPAVSYKFLESVEDVNPHLSECVTVDENLWKDCVEYHFRRGGLTRPIALLSPWPALVNEVKSIAEFLSCCKTTGVEKRRHNTISDAIKSLSKTPMSVQLLKDSGAGKILKKVIKSPHPTIEEESLQQLNLLLESWMSLAATSGVTIKGHPSPASDQNCSKKEDIEDLKIAEECMTWRQLFMALKKREDDLRASQGKRMREIRKNLAETRPKLVKVRPRQKESSLRSNHKGPSQHFEHGLSSSATNRGCANMKLMQVRREASIQSSRQQIAIPTKTGASFANAVAFASVSKKKNVKKSNVMELPGNKRMRVPTDVVKGAGPRQLASKWKKIKPSIP